MTALASAERERIVPCSLAVSLVVSRATCVRGSVLAQNSTAQKAAEAHLATDEVGREP